MRLDGTEAASSNPAGQYSHGNSAGTPHKSSISSLANGSSTNGDSNGHKTAPVRPTGSFFGHDREEVTRILIQGLTDLGYNGAATTLSRESGYELENTAVAAFRNAIQEGEWAEAERLLFGPRPVPDLSTAPLVPSNIEGLQWAQEDSLAAVAGLPLAEGANKKEMLFLIRQQRYLELLEQRDIPSALLTLRLEITPLHPDTTRLHTLTSLMMCATAQDLHRKAHWDGAAGESRNHLLSELSTSIAPSVMIPEHRLAVLFDKVQQNQIDSCLYHGTNSNPSLYHSHSCDRSDFPLQKMHELAESTGEIWYIAFSPNGKFLATASNNNNIFVYNTHNWRLEYRLTDHPAIPDILGIAFLAWSPDNTYLISCSIARQVSIYSISEGGRRVQTIQGYEYPVASAAWLPDSRSFVVASHDVDRPLELYRLGSADREHSFIPRRAGVRVRDVAVAADGSRIAAVTDDKRVQMYDLRQQSKPMVANFAMDDHITGIDLSPDGGQVLLSMYNSQLRLMDTSTGRILQSYPGLTQTQFVVRAALGGASDGFVITGSEDSHVYIHRRHSGQLVAALQAHVPSVVNAVAWHPTQPGVFASGGDDRKVIIWGSENEVARAQRAEH